MTMQSIPPWTSVGTRIMVHGCKTIAIIKTNRKEDGALRCDSLARAGENLEQAPPLDCLLKDREKSQSVPVRRHRRKVLFHRQRRAQWQYWHLWTDRRDCGVKTKDLMILTLNSTLRLALPGMHRNRPNMPFLQ
jgi:hypothetical protein